MALERDRRIFLSFCATAAVLLLLGIAFYLSFRTKLPPLLEFVRPGPPLFESVRAPGWMPSLIHVTAFGLLTCAFLRPGMASAIASGATWAGIDVLWEMSCRNHQAWLGAGVDLIHASRVPACTYDPMDVTASIAGAVATVFIAWLILKSHPVRDMTSKEQL
jgi:hypothetical protein